jgi:hypothetical protein
MGSHRYDVTARTLYIFSFTANENVAEVLLNKEKIIRF